MGNLKRKRSFDNSSSIASSPHAPSEHAFPPATFGMGTGYSFTAMDVDDGSSTFALARQEQKDVWWGGRSEMNIAFPDTSGRTRKRFRDGRPDEETIHRNTLDKLFSAQRNNSQLYTAPSTPYHMDTDAELSSDDNIEMNGSAVFSSSMPMSSISVSTLFTQSSADIPMMGPPSPEQKQRTLLSFWKPTISNTIVPPPSPMSASSIDLVMEVDTHSMGVAPTGIPMCDWCDPTPEDQMAFNYCQQHEMGRIDIMAEMACGKCGWKGPDVRRRMTA